MPLTYGSTMKVLDVGVVFVVEVSLLFGSWLAVSRALQTRIKEHKRAVHVGDSNSKVAQQAYEFNHNMEFDQATIVDRVTDLTTRGSSLRHGIL
ncbi:hypothetical protein ACROYT_G005353 [Oculina patagonica]